MSPTAAERHLSRHALSEYLSGAPATIVIPGAPVCRIQFEPQSQIMALSTPYSGQNLPDLLKFEYLDTRIFTESGTQWVQVVVRYAANGYEAYLLLSDIADLMQQQKLAFSVSVRSALETLGDLLTRVGSLSAERQIGLYGELLFLESCLKDMDPDDAVVAWKGFAHNEHDFVFPQACFEIKTTTAENRRHTISGLEQLVAVPGAPLWLVSVQLTASTGSSGRTLAQLVADVSMKAGPASKLLEASLSQAGWRERDTALYVEHQALRSRPTAYLVDQDFPKIDRHALEIGCARPELIASASYVIDVTTMTPGEPPSPGLRFTAGG